MKMNTKIIYIMLALVIIALLVISITFVTLYVRSLHHTPEYPDWVTSMDTNITKITDNNWSISIDGVIQNCSDKTINYALIKYKVYDDNGNTLDVAMDILVNWEPKEYYYFCCKSIALQIEPAKWKFYELKIL